MMSQSISAEKADDWASDVLYEANKIVEAEEMEDWLDDVWLEDELE
jgi:hypothetical protein